MIRYSLTTTIERNIEICRVLKEQAPSTALGSLQMLNKCQVNKTEESHYTLHDSMYLCLNLQKIYQDSAKKQQLSWTSRTFC